MRCRLLLMSRTLTSASMLRNESTTIFIGIDKSPLLVLIALIADCCLVLVGPFDQVRANRRGVLLIEHRLEGRHAGILHLSVEHDLVEEIVAEEARCPQI